MKKTILMLVITATTIGRCSGTLAIVTTQSSGHSDNAYGIYLFQVLIVIALQKILLSWDLNASIKFISATVIGILLSLVLSASLRKIELIKRVI